MSSRRAFLGQVATSLGGLASVPRNVLGANDRIRLGIIGYGDRGSAIAREAAACPNTEFVAVTDIYTKQLERAKAELAGVKTYMDHRQMLDDKSIDAVLIATPQHLHCRALRRRDRGRQARLPGKDHGVHGGPCQADARGLSAGEAKQTVQIGHQSCSSGQVPDAMPVPETGNSMGQITAIHAAHVPQHAARQTAVGAAGLSGHDAGEHPLEVVSGRSAARAVRCQPLPQLALLLGLFGRQRLREHVPPGFVLVQGDGPADPEARSP